MNSGKGYLHLEVPACPIAREQAEEKLRSIIVSYKPDHGTEGKLYAETAMAKHAYPETVKSEELQETEIQNVIQKSIREEISALAREYGFKKAKKLIKEKYPEIRVLRDKWVTRAPLPSLSERDIPNIADTRIRKQVEEFIETHPVQTGQKLRDVLALFSEKEGIYSIRYFPKDQVSVPIESVKNKAYMPGDYYKVDIWRIPFGKGKYKYEGVFVSRPQAALMQLRGNTKAFPRHPHPAAKLIMSLCKDDIIEVEVSNVSRELCRVAGFSTTQNCIDIRPIYASDTIAAWMKNTNIKLTSSFWPRDIKGQQFFKSINVLFGENKVRQAKITADGRIFYR
jgi:CRISPR-associated endonuclease Csn1